MSLSSIRPEIQDFVSRENRSHADSWLQKVDWVELERTLTLFIRRPPTALAQLKKTGPEPATWDREGLLATLTRPSVLKIYLPASLDERPFCFCEDDVLVPAVEAANGRLRPLSCNSVLAVVTTVLQCVKKELPPLGPLGDSQAGAGAGAARAQLAAQAILGAVKEDPLGADLGLALLSMAVSSYRRDTVSTPFPRQLESDGLHRAYSDFVSCLKDIPSMQEISSWTSAADILKLPGLAVLALHFVLVCLPTRLRTPNSPSAHSAASPASGDRNGSAATASPAPSSGKGGGVFAKRSGVGTAGGVGMGRGGSGGGAVGVFLRNVDKLFDVPSYVFDVMLPSDPAFDAEAERGGWNVAYHGSSPENFHSILNTGLRVMSGSRLMKNGAAFGQGIYLSESRVAAAAFASRGDGSGTTVWPRSVFGNSTTAGAGAGVGATTGSCGSAPANARHKNIWYRLVRRRSAFGNSTTAGTGVGADVGATTKSNASVPADAQHKKFRYRLVAKCRVLKGDGVKEIEGGYGEASYFVVSDHSRVRVEALLLYHDGQASEKLAAFAAAPIVGKGGEKVGGNTGKDGSKRDGGSGEGIPERLFQILSFVVKCCLYFVVFVWILAWVNDY